MTKEGNRYCEVHGTPAKESVRKDRPNRCPTCGRHMKVE